MLFFAARMEMGFCKTIYFIKAKFLLRSNTARPTLNQSSSPQQTAATTPDTVLAMPCLIMKGYIQPLN